jgi:hypothetical protein
MGVRGIPLNNQVVGLFQLPVALLAKPLAAKLLPVDIKRITIKSDAICFATV